MENIEKYEIVLYDTKIEVNNDGRVDPKSVKGTRGFALFKVISKALLILLIMNYFPYTLGKNFEYNYGYKEAFGENKVFLIFYYGKYLVPILSLVHLFIKKALIDKEDRKINYLDFFMKDIGVIGGMISLMFLSPDFTEGYRIIVYIIVTYLSIRKDIGIYIKLEPFTNPGLRIVSYQEGQEQVVVYRLESWKDKEFKIVG